MAEEFHESDILFAHHHHHRPIVADSSSDYPQIFITNSRNKKLKKKDLSLTGSLPVKIPHSVFHYASDSDEYLEEEWDDDESEEIVPPHVIIGRRAAGKMAFSVCTGNGRTLKGRDLSQVRNSILRLTGFLET